MDVDGAEARARAEASFKKEHPSRSDKGEAELEAMREKTARLRALRLASAAQPAKKQG